MSYIFDLTENMQASIRLGTGIHPDGPSLGLFIGTPTPDTGETPKTAFDVSAYDACDWDRAVKFAQWIMIMDKAIFSKEEPQ